MPFDRLRPAGRNLRRDARRARQTFKEQRAKWVHLRYADGGGTTDPWNAQPGEDLQTTLFRIGYRLIIDLERKFSRTREVEASRLLIGDQVGLPPRELAVRDFSLAPLFSTPILQGPHAAMSAGDPETYLSMGRSLIGIRGSFFGSTSELEIVQQVAQRRSGDLGDVHGRKVNDRPLVRPVAGSNHLQVIDGHHRLAELQPGDNVSVDVVRRPGSTPAIDLVSAMTWLPGRERALYQPVPLPEFSSWSVARGCRDRLALMEGHLEQLGLSGGTYLDIASCYGWFVAEFSRKGYTASGVERDLLAPAIGQLAYGLDPTQIVTADACDHLTGLVPQSYDVVSCFSLLHHLLLDEPTIAAALFSELRRLCPRVLFFDFGQSSEQWFRDRPGLSVDAHEDRLTQAFPDHSVSRLGTDDDGERSPGNFGRTVFAVTLRS